MENWKSYARQLHTIERAYLPKILKALKSTYSSFTDDLKQHGISHARSRLNAATLTDDILPIIDTIYRKIGLWGAKKAYDELKQSAGSKGFGRNEKWIAEVLQYLKLHGLDFARSISSTTRDDILKILDRGVEQNLSIADIVTELRTTGIVRARAETIARTEIFRAANVGHVIGAKSFPYEVNKKWIAAGDHRTRHSHRKVNGHVVDEFGAFIVPIYRDKDGTKLVGHDKMMFPHDPNASAANTINCRCRVIHEPKRDADGQLILRRHTPATILPLAQSISQTAAALLGFALGRELAETLTD